MGNGRRKRIAGSRPASLADRLTAAWHKNGGGGLEELFNECMQRTDPVDVFEGALGRIADSERPSFSAALFDEAGHILVPLRVGASPAVGHLRVFTVPAYGTVESFAGLKQAGIFGDLTKLVRRSGFARQDSNVVILSVAMDPANAADVMPDSLRRLAASYVGTAMGGQASEAEAILVRLASGRLRAMEGSAPGCATRIYYGARLSVQTDVADEPSDLLDQPAGGAVGGISLAKARFERAARAMAVSHGLDLEFGAPSGHADGLGAMGLLQLRRSLEREAASRGMTLGSAAEAHYAFSGDSFFVSIKDGRTVHGPAEIPAILATYGMLPITGWMTGGFAAVVPHDDASSLERI